MRNERFDECCWWHLKPTKFKAGFLGRTTYRDQNLKSILAGNEKSRPLDLVGRRSRGESWSEGKGVL